MSLRPALWSLLLALSLPLAAQGSYAEAFRLVREGQTTAPEAVAPFKALAARYGTPLYVYDGARIEGQFKALHEAFAPRFPGLQVHYAVKANPALEILRLARRAGAHPEVVSVGEIELALKAGFRGRDILFTSSSKGPDEIRRAVALDAVVNIDSAEELEQLGALSKGLKRPLRISFRINPGVDGHTIHQINTGVSDSKFGLHLEEGLALAAYRRALAFPGLKVVGAHCHIGSQLTDPSVYLEGCRKMLGFAKVLKDELKLELQWVDLGGGLGIPYQDGQQVMSAEDLAAALQPVWEAEVAKLGYRPALWLEPGRFFVGASGILVTRVNSVKKTPVKTFVNVDAGFNTLLRPALYQAYHRVRALGSTGPLTKVDVAGNVCETGDILAAGRELPLPAAGDLLLVLDAGAYGMSMASTYNSRPLPAEVMVRGSKTRLLRGRGRLADLARGQR